MRKITLQISLAPSDVRHARVLLPHQLRTWGGQVDDVLLVVDETPGRGRRFGEEAARDKPELDALIETLRSGDPKLRRVNVDDAPDVRRAVARRFFGRDDMPANDFRGGPFYAYIYALHAAEHDLVLHVDADMLFGGGSDQWAAEAAEILEHRPDVLACNPLPGPPTRDGTLHNLPYVMDQEIAGAYRFDRLSTRFFLLDRRRLLDHVGPLPLRPRPRLRSALTALAGRHPLALAPEDLISLAMQRAGMVRLDFLGRPPGMWILHPVVRPEAFFAALPELLARIERGEVTDAQRGHYDIHPSMLEVGS